MQVDQVVLNAMKGKGRRKEGKAVGDILSEVLEPRREIWLERLVLLTLWLRSQQSPPSHGTGCSMWRRPLPQALRSRIFHSCSPLPRFPTKRLWRGAAKVFPESVRSEGLVVILESASRIRV